MLLEEVENATDWWLFLYSFKALAPAIIYGKDKIHPPGNHGWLILSCCCHH